jgi:hypothetical protein
MDRITTEVVKTLSQAGYPIEMLEYELGLSYSDIRKALQAPGTSHNILAEQLTQRLSATLEIAIKQIEHILCNGTREERLKAAAVVVKAASAIAKLRHQ